MQLGEPPLKIVPPRKWSTESGQISIRLPKDMVERLDEISKETGYSRAEIAFYFFDWAIPEYERQKLEREGEKKLSAKK